MESSDHPLGPGEIFVIYAKGQTMDSHSHKDKVALDVGPFSDHHFYTNDEVKYHGSTCALTEYRRNDLSAADVREIQFHITDKNRGVRFIEFVSASESKSNWESDINLTDKKKMVIQSTPTSGLNPKQNFGKNDYLNSDNGSFTSNPSRHLYFSAFLSFVILYFCS